MAPSKHVKISEAQKEIMLHYMLEHPDFAYGRLLGPLGKRKAREMWEELTAMLNSCGFGATKEATKWKTSWSDWKLHTKAKASSVHRYSQGTGGGGAPVMKLTPLEEKLLDFLGPEIVTGDLGIIEAGFPAQSEDINDTQLTCVSVEDDFEVGISDTSEDANMQVQQTHLQTTPFVASRKRKATSAENVTKKRRPADETAYDRAADTFKDVEVQKLNVLQEMNISLAVISDSSIRKAIAAERRAGAAERKAAAAERMAAALERIANDRV